MGKTRAPKKKKLEIVFDPEKRKDFLTGFRKRKNERRKKAKEQLENTLKEERKRIRQDIKDGITHMKKSFEPLKELTEQDKVEDEYEDDDVKVKIVELTTNELAAQNNFIGENRAPESESEEEEEQDDEDDDNMMVDKIPGMDLVEKKTKKRSKSSQDDEDEAKKNKFSTKELKSKKDIDRLKKKKTINQMKKTKAFKMKERLDKQANQKKIRRDKNNTLKSLPKSGLRKMKKGRVNRFSKGRMISRKDRKGKKK